MIGERHNWHPSCLGSALFVQVARSQFELVPTVLKVIGMHAYVFSYYMSLTRKFTFKTDNIRYDG